MVSAFLTLGIGLCIFFVESCRQDRVAQRGAEIGAQRKNAGSHFELDGKAVQTLRDRIIMLRLGDSINDAVSQIGKPARENLIGLKVGDWKCHEPVYDVRLVNDEPGNMGDQIVKLTFSRDRERLVAVWSNVAGIQSSGDATVCR
jgi:hypothetical protein